MVSLRECLLRKRRFTHSTVAKKISQTITARSFPSLFPLTAERNHHSSQPHDTRRINRKTRQSRGGRAVGQALASASEVGGVGEALEAKVSTSRLSSYSVQSFAPSRAWHRHTDKLIVPAGRLSPTNRYPDERNRTNVNYL